MLHYLLTLGKRKKDFRSTKIKNKKRLGSGYWKQTLFRPYIDHSFHTMEVIPNDTLRFPYCGHGLSKESKTRCPKLAIVKFLGVQFSKGDHTIFRLQQYTQCIHLN